MSDQLPGCVTSGSVALILSDITFVNSCVVFVLIFYCGFFFVHRF